MKKTGVAVALLVALGSVAACSDQRATTEHTATVNAPIQGGSDDGTAHPFAVGFCIDVGGNGLSDCTGGGNIDICSGALIAPNLVVTARHCVQNTDEQIDCSTSVFSGQRADNFYITTDPDFGSATHWHQVANINVPTPTPVCGNDIALLTLQDDIASTEATPITPVVQYPMTTHPMYSRQVTAIGYGATQAGTNPPGAGTRRIKGAIPIECVIGDTDFSGCDTVFDSGSIDVKEFITGDGTCQGDSGSSAYDQASFGANFQTFGVLSRGGEDGTTCTEAIYTRLDSWRDLIVQVVTTAAASGGYALPPWTQPAPAQAVDSGSPTQTGTGQLGDSCTNNSDCASNNCSSSTCTQACDDSNTCPDGYDCTGGFCFSSQTTADTGGNGSGSATASCGCKLAGGPTNPVPWKTLGIAIGAMVLVRRRSRRDRTS